MNKMSNSGIKRGQAITFRVPSDTPDHIIRELQKLKDIERRNFSSKIAEFVLEGIGNNSQSTERETLSVPLPKPLSKEQRSWIRHAHSEALIGNIIYQLLADPVRATSILASMNSTSLNIDEALYLQEEDNRTSFNEDQEALRDTVSSASPPSEDDLMDFDWESAKSNQSDEDEVEEKKESIDDLLGGFLDRMNK